MPWNSNLISTNILAVHAALLPTGNQGEILLFGGDEHWRDQSEPESRNGFKKTEIYNIETETIITGIESPESDIFCAGHAFTVDGRLLIGGGTSAWAGTAEHHDHALGFLGHRRCWIFNPRDKSWIETRRMRPEPGREDEDLGGGRWYPTLVTLGNGEVIAFFGHLTAEDTRHRNTTPEIYSLPLNNWRLLPQMAGPTIPPGGDVRHLMYARVFNLPNGLLFFATPMPVDYASLNDGTYYSTRYNPQTGDYVGHKIPQPVRSIYHGWSTPSVLLPLLPTDNYKPIVLFCGGAQAIKIDLSNDNAEWQNTSSGFNQNRRNSCAVILPTGEVALLGGVSKSNDGYREGEDYINPPDTFGEIGVNEVEIYQAGINWTTGKYENSDSWTTKEAAQIVRNYHSVALLMPNGKIWTAGGNTDAQSGNPDDNLIKSDDPTILRKLGIKTIEIYEPDYISVPNRLQINSSPKSVSYGQSFTVRISSNQADTIERVALIRNGAMTHAFNPDQRYVGVNFEVTSRNTIEITAPPNGNIAPPGYYMIWLIDNNGNPCELAKFVRVAYQDCFFILDRSTFSSDELALNLRFERALYVVYDGFLEDELGDPLNDLDIEFRFDSSSGDIVDEIRVINGRLEREFDATRPDEPQRITIVYDVEFINRNPFSTFDEVRNIAVNANLNGNNCSSTIILLNQPNPYMLDGEKSWLSTDLRVFQITEGGRLNGIIQGNSPLNFLRDVVNQFDGLPNNNDHPFEEISTDQADSKLEIARVVDGKRVYNYAIAKVRYRARDVAAPNAKVFFRMFNTAGTAMQYNPQTAYRRANTGIDAIPLIGRVGNNILSIPFFGTERVDSGAVPMDNQTDPINRKTLSPAGANEFVAYFGCWLDINQTTPQYPNYIDNDGPFIFREQRRSIQELVRGLHQCLVAEVFFEPDTTVQPEQPPRNILLNSTPGNSDKISQRNLAIVESDNPGSKATHTIQHTFELKPSRFSPKVQENVGGVMVRGGQPIGGMAMMAHPQAHYKRRPDELIIHRGNLPRKSKVQLFFSDIKIDDIFNLLPLTRVSKPSFIKVDDNTLEVLPGDICYIPIPENRPDTIPGLINIVLPEGVVKRQEFNMFFRQFDGGQRNIIGSFQLKIPVSTKEDIIESQSRQLSVMRHIASTISQEDKWYLIFARHINHLENKVKGLGGNPDTIYPSPNGDGKVYLGDQFDELNCQRTTWSIAALLAIFLIVLGIYSIPYSLPISVAGSMITLGYVYWRYVRKNCDLMDLLKKILLGILVSIVFILAFALNGGMNAYTIPVLILSAILCLGLAVYLFIVRRVT